MEGILPSLLHIFNQDDSYFPLQAIADLVSIIINLTLFFIHLMEFIAGTLLCLATFTRVVLWFFHIFAFISIDIFSQLSNVILYKPTIFYLSIAILL